MANLCGTSFITMLKRDLRRNKSIVTLLRFIAMRQDDIQSLVATTPPILHFGEKVWNEDVALAKSAELDGIGLLAVNLGKSESWELLDLVRENKEFRVNLVETRTQRKERVQEEVADAIAMEREESGSTEVNLEEGNMDEEEEMNRY